jgi:hypothetical protein
MAGSRLTRKAGRASRRPILLATAAVLGAAVSLAAQDSHVSGALTINGERTPVSFVYASARPGFFDKSIEDVRILLSDVALTAEERDDDFALIRRGRNNTAHIVEVVLDASGNPIAGALYAPVFNGMLSATGMHVFQRTRFDREGVAGRLSTSPPREIGGVTWGYDAEFTVSVSRPPTAAERAATAHSPAGEAGGRYVGALLRGDLAALRQLLTASAQRTHAGANGEQWLDRERREWPPDAAVVEVRTIDDGHAIAVAQGHAVGRIIEYELPLALENGG